MKTNWKKYAFEFISIFIAVISAFALNNWNDNQNNRISEEKILKEIKNGLELDLKDFRGNQHGHRVSLNATQLFRDIIQKRSVGKIKADSIQRAYLALFRDYTPIINLSGYESLKANGLKTVENDKLRFEIITLYDFYFEIIIKLEDEVSEFDSYTNYYRPINDLLFQSMVFDEKGQFINIRQPVNLTENEQRELLSYLWRLEQNRNYKLGRYKIIEAKIEKLKLNIESILD